MCIRTVLTYASPVFAHAALKHYIGYRTHRRDSSTSRDHIPMRSSEPRLTINRRLPPTLSEDHGTYCSIHLTLIQWQLIAFNDVNDTHD
ncbi:hypothetical protein EVAR_47872_1 [Eumeta japonica]|uniref:Uncharacterized protein n=1 Tax=Eumeta variegata TaxID=151549 RepID=A0A4C1ZVS4_EUMVA|nr:hypothetical protein EVAR_47872_1 [Eumeta japonica]